LIAVVETLRDMTDQKRAEAALKTLASSDGLTGLANRRSFDQALALEWTRAQRTKTPLSLLLVDVDYFKLYNDLHGHQKGDDCLRALAAAMGANMRPADVACETYDRPPCGNRAWHCYFPCVGNVDSRSWAMESTQGPTR
jgi:PleD family two-component response regulator